MANNTSDPDDYLGTSGPFVGEHIGQPLRVTFAVIGSVMIASAVLGNSTLIVIVVQNFMRNMRKYLHDLFIANLVLVDLLLMGYWFTFFIVDLALGYHPVANKSHCTANALILLALYTVNLNCLVSISFNRYLHVCHSHLYRRVFTLRSTVCWCLVIWIVSIIITVPPLFGGVAGFYFYNPKSHVCSYNREGFTYVKVMVILYTILPPVFITYFNVAIFRTWKKAKMSLSNRYPLANEVQNKTKKKSLMATLTSGKQTKKAFPGSVAAGTSLEHEVHFENQPELVSDSGAAVDSNVGPERSETLSDSIEESYVTTSVTNTEQKSYSANEGETSVTEVITELSDDLHVEVNLKDDVNSESDSDAFHSATSSEDFASEDKPDSHQQNDRIISTTDGDSRIRPELPDEADSQHVDAYDKTEGTDMDIETTTNADSSQCGIASVEALPAKPSPSTSGEPPKQPTLSTRGKHRGHQGASARTHQRRLQQKSRSREEAFVRSLLVVCILALVTFLPYTVVVIVDTSVKQSKEIHIAANLVIFINNSVNWIVYGAMNQAYKQGYVKYARMAFRKCRL